MSAFLVGDSVSLSLALGFDRELYRDDLLLTADVRLGCGVIVDTGNPNCIGQRESWSASLVDDRPDVVLLALAKWDVSDIDIGGETLAFASDAFDEEVGRRLERDRAVLAAQGARVIVVGLPCLQGSEEIQLDRAAPLRTDPVRVAHLNDLAATWAADSGLEYIDPGSFTCPTGEFQEELDGVALYRDGVHFTLDGAALVWAWLVSEIEGLAAAG